MAVNLFDDSWKGDVELQEKLKQYVKEALKREEILSFLRRDFSQYQWSIRTLDRRLRYFDIYYSDKNVTVYKVREDVSASRKLLWLKVWVSNSKPELIGRWYLEYLYKSRVIASYLRLDKGTETGIMATIHAFLRKNHGDTEPCDTVLYGPSTSNQVQYSNNNYYYNNYMTLNFNLYFLLFLVY